MNAFYGSSRLQLSNDHAGFTHCPGMRIQDRFPRLLLQLRGDRYDSRINDTSSMLTITAKRDMPAHAYLPFFAVCSLRVCAAQFDDESVVYIAARCPLTAPAMSSCKLHYFVPCLNQPNGGGLEPSTSSMSHPGRPRLSIGNRYVRIGGNG